MILKVEVCFQTSGGVSMVRGFILFLMRCGMPLLFIFLCEYSHTYPPLLLFLDNSVQRLLNTGPTPFSTFRMSVF